jgi:arylsulfatase A-like enzyme
MEEGGNRVPYLVRWPGVTDETADEIVDVPGTSPDVYATIVDAADAVPPAGQPVDGESLRPLLRGDEFDRDAVSWHHPRYGNQGATPGAAVRCGDWKLIEFFEDDHLELYHLGSDVGEETDLSEHCPDRTAELHDRLRTWQEEVGAEFPEGNPEFESWSDRAGPG